MSRRNFSKATIRRDNHKCVKCGSSENLTADHIKPLIMGGEDCLENLQTLCLKCHREKDKNLPVISTIIQATKQAIKNPREGSYAYAEKHGSA